MADSLPRDPLPEATLPWLMDPYGFVARRCRRLGADVFETRLLGRRTVCMKGQGAARLVYEDPRFVRGGAPPRRIVRTLFGRGGVQGLDGDAHRHRKELFLSFMKPESVDRFVNVAMLRCRAQAVRWERRKRVVLADELRDVLCRAACDWCGVPLSEDEVSTRARQLGHLFRFAGSVGPAHWRARLDRKRANAWAAGWIRTIREKGDGQGILATIALHRDLDGNLLDPRIAGVELLNLVRPAVAIAVYAVHAAIALHRWPQCRRKLALDPTYERPFVQEIRRFFPFFPAIAAKTTAEVQWNGYRIPRRRRILFDLHATNHDPNLWRDPERFEPERFRHTNGADPYIFVPQGGGRHDRTHRCPGEWITEAFLEAFVRFLVHELDYEVPEQDLELPKRQLPPLPRSGFVIRNVHLREPVAQ